MCSTPTAAAPLRRRCHSDVRLHSRATPPSRRSLHSLLRHRTALRTQGAIHSTSKRNERAGAVNSTEENRREQERIGEKNETTYEKAVGVCHSRARRGTGDERVDARARRSDRVVEWLAGWRDERFRLARVAGAFGGEELERRQRVLCLECGALVAADRKRKGATSVREGRLESARRVALASFR